MLNKVSIVFSKLLKIGTKRSLNYGQNFQNKRLGEVIDQLAKRQIEEAVGLYTTFCLADHDFNSTDRSNLVDFFSNRTVLKYLRSLKPRYYEFLISICPHTFRTSLEENLYRDFSVESFRQILRWEKASKSEFDFFKNRIEEWQKIYNRVPPVLTKEMLYREFDQFDFGDDKQLFQALIQTSPNYMLRKMQLPTLKNFERLESILEFNSTNDHPLKVLDYGCGSADLSIYLASMGHEITLCDVDKGNLESSIRRFELRGLKSKSYGANFNNPIPNITGEFDLIIGLEVLEHIRDPFKLLFSFDNLVSSNGIIMLGSFPFHPTNAAGDHLEEAVSRRDDLLKWINVHWKKLQSDKSGNAFAKRSPKL